MVMGILVGEMMDSMYSGRTRYHLLNIWRCVMTVQDLIMKLQALGPNSVCKGILVSIVVDGESRWYTVINIENVVHNNVCIMQTCNNT